MNNVDVSVVIVSYNEFQILKNCLKSFIDNAIGFSYELIVVDNASKEGDITQAISEFKDIKIIKNDTNLGFAAANNQGFAVAQGKYILILNNDTLFFENTVGKLIDYSLKIDQEFIIGCKLLNSDGTWQESPVQFDNILNMTGEAFFLYKIFKTSKYLNKYYMNYININQPVEVDYIKGAFMFTTKKVIDKLKGFDDRFFFYTEETDLCYRLKKNNGRVIFYPLSSIYHLNSFTVDKIPWFKFKNLHLTKIQFYQKHYSKTKFIILIFLLYFGKLLRIPIYFLSGLLKMNKNKIFKSFYYFKSLFVYPTNKFNY